MEKILKQCTLDKATRRKDKSISMSFITSMEQSSEEFMEIDKALDSTGILYFKPNGTITQKEIDELDKTDLEVEGKSKSQRLRSVLWVLWNQTEKDSIEFKEFYSLSMEMFILGVKNSLDED